MVPSSISRAQLMVHDLCTETAPALHQHVWESSGSCEARWRIVQRLVSGQLPGTGMQQQQRLLHQGLDH